MATQTEAVTKEIRIIACKLCGEKLNTETSRHCKQGCAQDGTDESRRPPESLEVRIYAFDRTESYRPIW